jgi:hypothetical protein
MSLTRAIATAGDRARIETVLRARRGYTSTGPWRVIGTAGNPSFQGGWSSRTAPLYGEAVTAVAFFRDAIGFTHLRGFADGVSQTGTTIFTLPLGYRPVRTTSELVAFETDSGLTNPSRILIEPNGDVVLASSPQLFIGSATGWVCLDGKRFRAS